MGIPECEKQWNLNDTVYLSCEDFVPNMVEDNSARVLIGQGLLTLLLIE